MRGTPGYTPKMEADYRFARSSEQVRVAEDLRDLYSTAGVLVVDAQGHGLISAKIASTVHDTFHALMLTELDRYGKTTPMLLENINLRLAQSVTARNALGITEKEGAREIATMLYGEVDPLGHFRFANFGHPPPLVFSAEYRKFMKIDDDHMVQFLALGLQLPAHHPDLKKYYSLNVRQTEFNTADLSEITLMSPGDILVLYTDGVYDGSDQQGREQLEAVMREHYLRPTKEICNALLDYATKQDDRLRQNGDGGLDRR
jgi:serine phosphatase RsbU (regulator of sigma subunit)